MTALVVVLVIVVLVAVLTIAAYNGLVKRRNRIEGAWSQIDVQLQRRHDLIPNLVETVKGYAAHEQGVFEQVSVARSAAVGAHSVAEQGNAELGLSQALGRLFAVAEAYPELKANQNFLALQEELTNTEGRISYARQYYNDAVEGYNTKLQTFPTSVLAGMFNFSPREYFQADGGSRGPVQVKF